jgi:hypothetical protein
MGLERFGRLALLPYQIYRNGFWYDGGIATELVMAGGAIYAFQSGTGTWYDNPTGTWASTSTPGGITSTLIGL